MNEVQDITAAIYVRVSSDKQVREGHGLESQETRCRAYCVMKGYPVGKVFIEPGVSGSIYNRPKYMEMLEYLDGLNGSKVVIVDHVDRITRDVEGGTQILNDLTKRNVGLEGPSWKFENTPEGKVFFHIQTALAQYHRESNARQVRNRTAARMSTGHRSVGGCAVGYELTGQAGIHAPYEPVASVVKEILEGYAYGRFNTYSEISQFLNAHKFPKRTTRKQKRNPRRPLKQYIEMNGDKVKNNILEKSWYYAGFIQNESLGAKRNRGLHLPIISAETMEAVESRLRGEKLPIYRKNLNNHFPLRGYVLCGHCRKPMMGSFCGGRDKEYGYYYCLQKQCERKNKNVRYEIVHAQFESMLKNLTPAIELLEFAEAVLSDLWQQEKDNSKTRVAELKDQILELNAKIEIHIDELLSTKSKATKSRIQERIDSFSEEKAVLEMKHDAGQLTQEDFNIVLATVKNLLRDPYNLWKEGDLEKKQVVQQLVFPNRLIYEQIGQNFRKPEKALLFSFLGELTPEKDRLVGPEGLEPPT